MFKRIQLWLLHIDSIFYKFPCWLLDNWLYHFVFGICFIHECNLMFLWLCYCYSIDSYMCIMGLDQLTQGCHIFKCSQTISVDRDFLIINKSSLLMIFIEIVYVDCANPSVSLLTFYSEEKKSSSHVMSWDFIWQRCPEEQLFFVWP